MAIQYANFDGVCNLDKLVEVRYEDGRPLGMRGQRKYTSLRMEVMDLEVTVDGVQVPVIQAISTNSGGLRSGTATAAYYCEHSAVQARISLIRQQPAGWFLGYWESVQGYSRNTIKSLMESFDPDSAALASLTTFSPQTLAVTGEFIHQEEQDIDEIERELGLDFDVNVGVEDEAVRGEGGAANVTVEMATAALARSLRDRDDASDAERSGPSRRSDFSQSTGNSSNRSVTSTNMAMNHRQRALENFALTSRNAELEARLAEVDAREVAILRQQEEMERMRAALQQNRGVGSGITDSQASMPMEAEAPDGNNIRDDSPRDSGTKPDEGGEYV